jgi:hypothetical protein
VNAQPDSLVLQRMARIMAARVVQVRWGEEALDEFLVQTDADVRAAVGYFPQVLQLLKGPEGK